METKKVEECKDYLKLFKCDVLDLFDKFNYDYRHDYTSDIMYETVDKMNAEEFTIASEIRSIIVKLSDVVEEINSLSAEVLYEGELCYEETDNRFYLKSVNAQKEDIVFHCGDCLQILVETEYYRCWQNVSFEINTDNEWFLTNTNYVGIDVITGIKARVI